MKNLKTFIAIVALSFATVVPASANNDTEPAVKTVKTELRSKIVSLLGHHSYTLQDQLTAEVSVMLNNQNELIVVSVDSNSKEVASFVKKKLNYKNVAIKGIKKGTIYRMPLKMVKSS